MNLFKYLLTLAITLGFMSNVYAQSQDDSEFHEELNDRDWQALYDYINTKRSAASKDTPCNLTISGEVRTEWRHLDELGCIPREKEIIDKKTGEVRKEFVSHYERLRGDGAVNPLTNLPISRNDFDIEFDLRFDYVCGRSWAVAHLQFDNSAGVDDNAIPCRSNERVCGDPEGYHGSGSCDDICLKKCYWGYNILNCGENRIDIEVGRRNIYNVFDSKVQFLSRFDGIFLKYSSTLECLGNWYWSGAAFVVDERVNHFAWVTEVGFLDIMDSGIDFKYSFIDWRKNGINRCLIHNPKGFQFLISQWTLYYHFNPELLGDHTSMLYGAFLWNHDASRFVGTCGKGCHQRDHRHGHRHGKKQNIAGYVGFTVGEVIEEGDWALDARYEYVQAHAMPDDDAAGICRGNVLNYSVTQNGRGNTNYHGWRFEGLYALTDNLSLDTILEFSREITRSIGGKHRYSKFELEAIYAF